MHVSMISGGNILSVFLNLFMILEHYLNERMPICVEMSCFETNLEVIQINPMYDYSHVTYI